MTHSNENLICFSKLCERCKCRHTYTLYAYRCHCHVTTLNVLTLLAISHLTCFAESNKSIILEFAIIYFQHIYIYVCVCVCVYVCMYECMYVCMYVYMYKGCSKSYTISILACLPFIRIILHLCVCVCVCACLCVWVKVFVCVCVCVQMRVSVLLVFILVCVFCGVLCEGVFGVCSENLVCLCVCR